MLFTVGGLLMAAGGQMHPHGSGCTVDAHLLSMFDSPAWPLAHLLLLLGGLVSVSGFVTAGRSEVFGPTVRSRLPLAGPGWGVGAGRAGPPPARRGRGAHLEHHEGTPVPDVHLVMAVMAPFGRSDRSAGGRGSRPRGSVACGLGARRVRRRRWRALGPRRAAGGGHGRPVWTLLFPFQAGLAVWLAGTAVRLFRQRGRA